MKLLLGIVAAAAVAVQAAPSPLLRDLVGQVDTSYDKYLTPSIADIPKKQVELSYTSPLVHPAEYMSAHSNVGTMSVYSETITPVPGAEWTQLEFSPETLLSQENPREAVLKIWSERDGAVQLHTADTLRQWGYKSALFNGDTVHVELLVTPRAGDVRVHVVSAETSAEAEPLVGAQTLCNAQDARRSTNERKAARYLPGGGCSAWLIDDAAKCFLTAGHCSGVGSVQFQVPMSTSSGSIQHPAPEDQYAVDSTSIQSTNGGVGNDWKHMGAFPNSNTGKTPYQAQKATYRLKTDGTIASHLTHTGYGVSQPRNAMSQTQKGEPDGGELYSYRGTACRYRFDTTGGDSGSGVEDSTGRAVCIHTHGGCNSWSTTSSNAGTAIYHTAVQRAIASPQGVCSTEGAAAAATAVYGADFAGDLNVAGPRYVPSRD
ncbi:MAG: hypothetical protein MHM6MM_008397 [Cercozoa sp. M6MM]